MCSSSARSASTSARPATEESAPSGISGKDASAFAKTSRSAAVERADSRPPLRIAALPDFSASEPICATASGRDSKMTRRTPRGHVTFSRTRPSSRSVRERTRPEGSGKSATARTPSAIPCTLVSSSFRRSKADAARGISLKVVRAASTIGCGSRSGWRRDRRSIPSATFRRRSSFVLVGTAASLLAASRARFAISTGPIFPSKKSSSVFSSVIDLSSRPSARTRCRRPRPRRAGRGLRASGRSR